MSNLYEELGNSQPNPPSISYYFLGGKMVGIRRVHEQADRSGQFRIVGDHLGSTTLIVDTSAPPVVKYREYYKPYGEVAFEHDSWADSFKPTSVGFTGQRLDEESGLMYFGARFYDPALSFFISADPTVPDPNKSGDLNRYLYAGGNPLRYIDTSGYGPNDYYVFVYGCVIDKDLASGRCGDPNTREFGEFGILLHIQYLRWQARYRRFGEENLLPDWDTWRKEHVRAVPAPDLQTGTENLDATLKSIRGNGNIYIWGHSMGAASVVQYLAYKYWDEKSGSGRVDPRIAGIALIDGPTDAAIGVESDFASWLSKRTRIGDPKRNFLQVVVPQSVIGTRPCIAGVNCITADYSNPKRTDARDIGPAGFDVPGLQYANDTRIKWHEFTYHALFYTNYESYFWRMWR